MVLPTPVSNMPAVEVKLSGVLHSDLGLLNTVVHELIGYVTF